MATNKIKIEWLLLCQIICGLASCTASTADTIKEVNIQAPSTERVTIVTTAPAKLQDFEYLIRTNGKIRSLHELTISSESSGRLMLCHATPGNSQSAGSVIAQLETTPIRHRLERAMLAEFNCEKEYESQLLGYENLLREKTKEESEDIRRKLMISSGLSLARQEIKEANYELEKATIKAPFDGVFANVKIREGDFIKSGQEMFMIYDPSRLLLEIKVLEADISLIRKGMSAEIASISTPGTHYKASVFEVNPYVDADGMVSIKLLVSPEISGKKNLFLFPGMNCVAKLIIPVEKSIVIPKEAVVMRNSKPVVFTLEQGLAKWNYVKPGRENEKEIEIKEGLTVNQKVILSNNIQLAHDAPVKEGVEKQNVPAN